MVDDDTESIHECGEEVADQEFREPPTRRRRRLSLTWHQEPEESLLRRPALFPEVVDTRVDSHADHVATVREVDDWDAESVAFSVPDVSGEEDSPVEEDVALSSVLVFGAGARAAFRELDEVELDAEFITRACVMKSPPVFLRGQYRSAMRFALLEAQRAREQHDEVGSTRAWKLFLLLPRLLLYRPHRGGLIPKGQLQERFADFAAGRWAHLLLRSRRCAEQAAVASRRRRRRQGENDIQRRADRAEALVQMGSCRQADTPSKALLSRLGVRPPSTSFRILCGAPLNHVSRFPMICSFDVVLCSILISICSRRISGSPVVGRPVARQA